MFALGDGFEHGKERAYQDKLQREKVMMTLSVEKNSSTWRLLCRPLYTRERLFQNNWMGSRVGHENIPAETWYYSSGLIITAGPSFGLLDFATDTC